MESPRLHRSWSAVHSLASFAAVECWPDCAASSAVPQCCTGLTRGPTLADPSYKMCTSLAAGNQTDVGHIAQLRLLPPQVLHGPDS